MTRLDRWTLVLLLAILPLSSIAELRTIHVFVALCDNEFQGIVPVPASIGNGKDPGSNLYWGAGYGVKHFFDKKTDDWVLIGKPDPQNPLILESLLFKHKTEDVYLLADAYDGEFIKNCTEDFLLSSNKQKSFHIKYDCLELGFGGAANLLAYVGHDGLMDFSVDLIYNEEADNDIGIVILACYSRDYFQSEIQASGANPQVWTTHLMAPEAYTLKAIIDGWVLKETPLQLEERAAVTYDQYQKCGLRGARNLFTSKR